MSAVVRSLDGRTEHGVWDGEAGGFVDSGIYTEDRADEAVAALVALGNDPAELAVLPFCQDHRDDEQPAGSCESCDAEDDEDDE